jgi:hypothetical protein
MMIEEIKATGDPNVMAFLRDVGKLKRMPKKQRDYYLRNRQQPGAVTKLLEGFIPYVIMVAYNYTDKARKLTLLDLINEGILGAYAAFEKNSQKGDPLTRRRVRSQIKTRIRKAVYDGYKNPELVDFDEFRPEGLNKEILLFGI